MKSQTGHSVLRRAKFLPFIAMMFLHPHRGLSEEPVTRVFQGVVSDSNGNPVHGAAVEWGHYLDDRSHRETVRTDEKGNYRLETTKAGPNRRLGVFAIGYGPRWRDGLIPKRKGSETGRLDYKLAKPLTLRGTVVDRSGKPVPGVSVLARSPDNNVESRFVPLITPFPFPGPERKGVTNSDGQFVIRDLPATQNLAGVMMSADEAGKGEPYALYVEYPNSLLVCGRGYSKIDNKITVDRFDFDPAVPIGEYAGKVVDDQSGQPISTFRITVRHRTGMTTVDGKGDDEAGVFRIPGHRVGRKHQIIVYADGYEPLPKSIPATEANKSHPLPQWRLKRSPSLRGSLVDDRGDPIEGAEILCGIMDENARGVGIARQTFYEYADGNRELKYVQRTTTGPNGAFVFSQGQTKPGLVIKASGFAWKLIFPEELDAFAEDGELRIPLLTESVVTGAVELDGVPVSKARVGLVPTARSRLMSASTHVDPAGKFRLDGFAPGQYRLRVSLSSDKGVSYRYSQTIELLGGTTLEPNLNHRTGPLTIKGKATAFSYVKAMSERDAEVDGAYDLPSIGTFATPDGTFELSGLYPETYTFTSSRQSWRGPVTKTLALTQSTEIDLTPSNHQVVPKHR